MGFGAHATVFKGLAYATRSGHVSPGAYFRYTWDGIGNRTLADKNSSAGAGEAQTANKLNQVTALTTPGTIPVAGYAKADQTVLVNGQPAHRDGTWYYAAVAANNAAGLSRWKQ